MIGFRTYCPTIDKVSLINPLEDPQQLPPNSAISYDPAHFPALLSAEEKHFWFRARNAIIATLVRQLDLEYSLGYRFLEIGCGNGNVLRELEQVCARGSVIGVDLFLEGLRFARQRVKAPLFQADIYALPFKDKFEMIGLFDVIEHLPDDMQILSQVHQALPSGGSVLITVPAYQALWSYSDRLADHKRRYTTQSLTEKLNASGYKVTYITYFMMSIVPIVWLSRTISNAKIARSSDPAALEQALFQNELDVSPIINKGLSALLKPETRFIHARKPMPFGTSVLALAHKA